MIWIYFFLGEFFKYNYLVLFIIINNSFSYLYYFLNGKNIEDLVVIYCFYEMMFKRNKVEFIEEIVKKISVFLK